MSMKRISLIVAVVVVLAGMAVQAQTRDEQQSSGKATTVTGCLAKGDSPNEFYLNADDGKKYELRSDNVSLSEHVGHKITVTGTPAKESAAEEKHEGEGKNEATEKRQGEHEKNEAAENGGAHLRVSKVKMVSDSCQ